MNYKAKAIELLGEEIKVARDCQGYLERHADGYNQMHSKAVDVVVGLLEGAAEQRLNNKESIASLTKSCKEAIAELQTLKNKLTVDKLRHILATEALRTTGITKFEEYAEALIKELKSTNDK